MEIKKIWKAVCVPMAFFLGAMYMFMGEIGVGCIFIMFATNEVINKE